MTKVAVVGAGSWGKNHVRNFHALDALGLVCDSRPEALSAVRDDYPGVSTTESFEDVLASDQVQGVAVVTNKALWRVVVSAMGLASSQAMQAFEEVDVIISPTTPTPAFKEGEKVDDPLQMYLNDIFTIPANLAGLPGMSQPCGFTEAGLPVGMQLMAAPMREDLLFKVAHAYEQATGLADTFPEL